MKTFAQLRQPLTELTAFQDPPQVLVLRRKGVRVFPGDQRVATYRNDNLNIEVAIPYDPHTLGHGKTSTSGISTEEVVYEAAQYTPEQLKIRRERRTLHGDVQRNQHKIWDHEFKAKSQFTDPKKRDWHHQQAQSAKQHHEWSIKALIAHQEKHGPLSGIDHPMDESTTCPECHGTGSTPGQKDTVCPWCHGDGESGRLKTWDDMRKFHQSIGPQQHAISKQMRALLTGEEVVTEAGQGKPSGQYAKFLAQRAAHNKGHKFDPKCPDCVEARRQGKDPETYRFNEEAEPVMEVTLTQVPLMEATLQSLHTITKRKLPAMVKFKSGASAMVHHETAARIMKLHSMMKKANKRKIEGLVNSSPDGLKKVIEFATVHMKG